HQARLNAYARVRQPACGAIEKWAARATASLPARELTEPSDSRLARRPTGLSAGALACAALSGSRAAALLAALWERQTRHSRGSCNPRHSPSATGRCTGGSAVEWLL